MDIVQLTLLRAVATTDPTLQIGVACARVSIEMSEMSLVRSFDIIEGRVGVTYSVTGEFFYPPK